MKRLTILLLMAFALPAVGAEMYKWTTNGQVVFGDTPPKGVAYEPVLLRGKEPNIPPSVAKSEQSGMPNATGIVNGNVMPSSSDATTESSKEALIAKRKADEEARDLSRKQCNEANERTNQLLAMPVNKRPMDFDAQVMALKKETATICR